MPLAQPYIGQQIRYVMEGGAGQGEVRGAVITKVYSSTAVNLRIELDLNDVSNPVDPLEMYRTNVQKGDDDEEGKWHFIPLL